jgi:hypothetical protein
MEPRKYRSTDDQRSIIVRKATKRDIPRYMQNPKAVASEEVYLGTERVTQKARKIHLDRLKNKKNLTIVALVDGKIVGSLTLWWSGLKKMKHVRELGILVIDGYREIGVGWALMDYAIRWVKRQNEIEKVVLEVFSPNKRAIHLYKKFGFKIEGVLKDEHILKGEYVDEIRMALFLKRQ